MDRVSPRAVMLSEAGALASAAVAIVGVAKRSIPALLEEKMELKVSYREAPRAADRASFMGMLRASCGVAQHDSRVTCGYTNN